MNRDHRRACIAKTDVRLARYSFGFRPIVVPWEANCNSPRTILSPSLGCGGEGVALLDCEVTPASVSLNLHEVPCAE